ncbi:unnamed protein product [Prorocentrum cordatum]|uniref:Uncharacterized protein n=1 Tax=Prorocentrum cordatum TaxID=2364126 RepID=A0ABN9VLJ3_9DINO|nr:unnamed protein product [Polarella glacialis]
MRRGGRFMATPLGKRYTTRWHYMSGSDARLQGGHVVLVRLCASHPRPNSVDELPTIPAASAPSPTPASVDDLPTAPVGDLPERRRLASSSPEGSRGVAVQDLAEQVPWAQSRPEALLPLDPIVV